MISNEPVITVSPEETTTYRLKVTTEKGLVDYTDIIVYVKDVLECRFDYNTGNVVSQYGTFLTKKQALSSNWNVNGSSISTVVDFTNTNPLLVSSNKGGITFSSECFIPDNSETLIVGISVDNIKGIALYNNKVQIGDLEYPFNEESYITFDISALYDSEDENWILEVSVINTITRELIINKREVLDVGVFDSDLFLYFIGSSTAKAGFYYGSNGEPVAIITRNHLSVPVGSQVVLDGLESYDPNGDVLDYEWFSKPLGSSDFSKLYKYDDTITETINGTTVFKLNASDFENTASTETIVTNYTVEKLDDYAYRLTAVNDDVQDLYTYQWTASDGTVDSSERVIVVQPLGGITYSCLITELSSGVQDTIEISLGGTLRIIHAYDTINDIYQEIKVYPDTRLLDKYIDCIVDGYQGYIAVGEENNPHKSILRCRINGMDYRILLFV